MSSGRKPAKPSSRSLRPKPPDARPTLCCADRFAVNHVELTARIAESSPLRYTPAGIPAVNFLLEHESEIVEAGVARKVKLTIKAVAFAALAEQTAGLALGQAFGFTGFLINVRAGKGVVFHIQALQPIFQAEQTVSNLI